jgi:class 3 adenylate cyclase/tetratricopeptide (TPR) repeat protein
MARCSACGREVDGDFQFCPFCGTALAEGRESHTHERKVVSILFCDLVGFTAASENADPEDVEARLRPYLEQVQEVLQRHGGTVEKFIGDAVMAVFGAPVAHEDDAERAIRAGLRTLETIEDLNAAAPELSLQVRIGINTGEALIALDVQPGLGKAYVTGDIVNTASRLQGVAPVGGIAVSEATHRATERVFDWERLETAQVKGKSEPLAVWRPLAPRARLGTDVTRNHATPLVGRELERSLLLGTFERAAQQRSCQLVTVVGEPGVGKSRLCAELLTHLEQSPALVRWRQGRCLPYGDGIAFWALGEIVKAEGSILETDPPRQVSDKLAQAVSTDDPERPWLLARLAPLVGLPAEPATQDEAFAAWRRFCEGLAAERTTVLVFEDLHWADPALLAFLEHLAEWAEGVPLLVLCTARPELYESQPTFGAGARNAQRINLVPLTDAETAQLVSTLLEREVLPVDTRTALLERAGGNPLYAEEFVRLLADHGELAGNVEVPESVQALIAARLDTLPAERKSLLQDASVVGKVFWAGALAAMGDRDPAEVELALHELARKELVRPARTSSMEGEREYAFWHVLVRDVCYGQIPRAARAARHHAAAAWLEAKAGERADDMADVLAHHYQAALELNQAAGVTDGEDELRAQAVRYLALAGERALALDVELAEPQLARALEFCPEGDPIRASLLEYWGRAIQQRGRLQEARKVLEQALDLYREQGEPIATGRVLIRLGNVTHRLGDPRREDVIAEAVELLEAQPPGPELVSAYSYFAAGGLFVNDPRRVLEGSERAIALAAELGLPEPAFALHNRGLVRGEEGLDDLRRALDLALEQGLGRETAVIYGNFAGAVLSYPGPQVGLEATEEAAAFCERRGITELALQVRAQIPTVLAALGQTDQALVEVGPLVEQIEATGDMSWLDTCAEQLRLLAECGSTGRPRDPNELVAAVREIGLPDQIAIVVVSCAQLMLAQGEPDEARMLLRELEGLGADPALGQLLPSVLRVVLALDELPLAERLAAPALAAEPSIGFAGPYDPRVLASVQAELAEAHGEQAEAAAHYADAAGRWQEFGSVPERAYALLGQGRCLAALNDPGASEPLRLAEELFALMRYEPARAQAQALRAALV